MLQRPLLGGLRFVFLHFSNSARRRGAAPTAMVDSIIKVSLYQELSFLSFYGKIAISWRKQDPRRRRLVPSRRRSRPRSRQQRRSRSLGDWRPYELRPLYDQRLCEGVSVETLESRRANQTQQRFISHLFLAFGAGDTIATNAAFVCDVELLGARRHRPKLARTPRHRAMACAPSGLFEGRARAAR